jgi:flagellar M-ring protein FliF
VPRADLARIRMELAGKGMPSGGGVGYEIFDKGDAFSSTSFVQNMNHLRALEGELSRSIRTLARVQSARVHLALPERRLFERDREAARASIVLKLRGEIGADQVQAIRHLVASGVEGLTPERVSVVDERGRLLADGAGTGGGPGMAVAAAADKRVALERRLRTQVEELVAGIVGSGRSRVQVSAELDLNRVESRSEAFDPESRVVRSTQTRGETATTTNGEGQVTVGNELPGAQANAQPPANAPRDNSNKTEEVINYEISRTTRTEVQEAGRVKRLSVAVLVDGVYARPPNGGEPAYQARSKEDLDRIAALVRSAVGFDGARGDQVEVVNLPFADTPIALEAEKASLLGSLFSPSRHDMMRFAEIGVIALLTLIVLLVVVRPMVKRMLAPDGLIADGARAIAGPGDAVAIGSTAPQPALAGAPPPSLALGRAALETAEPNQIARLGELARSNPRQAAAVLRGWMADS